MKDFEKRYNTKVKLYPSGQKKATIASRPIFKEKREVGELPCGYAPDKVSKPKCKCNEPRLDSVNRAKSKIFDIVALNGFTHFVTLTFSSKYVDRYDTKAILSKLKAFLSNNVQRHDLQYVLCPEFHEDGAIHFHGFFKGDITYIDSGTVMAPNRKKPIKIETAKRYKIPLDSCETVYNIPAWSYGWSAVREIIDGLEYVAKYTTKYVTKDSKKIYGSFYFAGGQGLAREVPQHLLDVPNPHEVKAEHQSYCEYIDCSFKYLDSNREDDKIELDYLGI
jgi:hypothetical protein